MIFMGCIQSPPEDTRVASDSVASSPPLTAYERFLKEHKQANTVKAEKRRQENNDLIEDWWVKFCQRMFAVKFCPSEILVYVFICCCLRCLRVVLDESDLRP